MSADQEREQLEDILRSVARAASRGLKQVTTIDLESLGLDKDRGAPSPDAPVTATGAHPRDLPSEAQGAALAALDSGRWTLDAAAGTLVGEPAPADAASLAAALRARDWLRADGALTAAGHHALERWLTAA